MKLFAIAFCISMLAGAILTDPALPTMAAIAASFLTWVVMDWRYGTIIRAAKAAVHGFCFSDGGLAEIRELSKVVLTMKPSRRPPAAAPRGN